MFPAEVYIQRRKRLRELVGKGVILFLGNKEVAINYGANNYPFRQDSSFLYYFGLDLPGLAGMIDCEMAVETLYGSDPTLEDIIWVGNHEPLQERALPRLTRRSVFTRAGIISEVLSVRAEPQRS